MGAISIINQAISTIADDISQGTMSNAVSQWETLASALGKCASICGGPLVAPTEKCGACLVKKLMSESNVRHRNEQERQHYAELAHELQKWIDLTAENAARDIWAG